MTAYLLDRLPEAAAGVFRPVQCLRATRQRQALQKIPVIVTMREDTAR